MWRLTILFVIAYIAQGSEYEIKLIEKCSTSNRTTFLKQCSLALNNTAVNISLKIMKPQMKINVRKIESF